MFCQHPAWFISLQPIETCGLLLKTVNNKVKSNVTCMSLQGIQYRYIASDRAVRVRALAGGHCVVFLGKTLYSHSASLHPGVPANCWENLTNCCGVTCDGLASSPGGVEILLAASCYGNQDKLWPDEPVLAPKASLFSLTLLRMMQVKQGV